MNFQKKRKSLMIPLIIVGIATLFWIIQETTKSQIPKIASYLLERNDPEEDPTSLLPTTLKLKLSGTIVAKDRTFSIASINSNAYSTNVQILDIAVVNEIERLRVILYNKKSHQREILNIAPFEPNQALPPGDIFKQSKTEFQIPREKVDNAIKDFMKSILDAGVTLVMNPDGTTIEGFQLTFLKPGSVFSDLGLIKGDVLRSINGMKLDSAMSGLKIFEALRDSSWIQLEITRGDQHRKFDYFIR